MTQLLEKKTRKLSSESETSVTCKGVCFKVNFLKPKTKSIIYTVKKIDKLDCIKIEITC